MHEPYEHKLKQLAVINKYLKPIFAQVSSQIRKNKNNSHIFCDGQNMFMVADRSLKKVDQQKHDLVGVYNSEIDPDDLRDDLCWYAINYLEVQQ